MGRRGPTWWIGAAKPSRTVFDVALDRLGLLASDVLMVGDRRGWDGAAADVGITTLVLPPLRSVDDERLHRVLQLAVPGLSWSERAGNAEPR
jgi:FMN phosphatase YigB (HAD superfamily)